MISIDVTCFPDSFSLDQESCFLFSSILMNKSVVNSNIEDSLKNLLCIEGHISLDCHHIIYFSKSVLLQGDDDGLQEWCFHFKQLPERESGFLQSVDEGFQKLGISLKHLPNRRNRKFYMDLSTNQGIHILHFQVHTDTLLVEVELIPILVRKGSTLDTTGQ